jgi:hypothetical protein
MGQVLVNEEQGTDFMLLTIKLQATKVCGRKVKLQYINLGISERNTISSTSGHFTPIFLE